MSELPNGWEKVEISQVNSYSSETLDPSKHSECKYELYSVPAFSVRNPEHLYGSEIGSSKQRVKPNDVLLCKINPRINRVWSVIQSDTQHEQIASSEWIVFRQPLLCPNFVRYQMSEPSFRDRLCAETSGVGGSLTRAQPKKVDRYTLAIAPINEQRRVAEKLDGLLAQVAAIKSRIDAVPALIRNFRTSVLSAAVSGRVTANSGASPEVPFHLRSPLVFFKSEEATAPGNWKWQKLVDVATLESGHTPRKSVPAYWEGGTVPWISLQDIRAADGKEIFSTKFMPTELGIKNSSARLLPKGTVCFSRDISVGFVTIMGRSMATTQHFANWICGDELHPKYLMYAFMAGREHLLKSGQGSTVKTIYMPALKELRILLPPLAEQAEIVRRVEHLFDVADQLEAKVATAKQRIDALTQSLLAKAFRGELVPQDPNDEPASVLLERIRAQRAAAPKPKRGRKPASN